MTEIVQSAIIDELQEARWRCEALSFQLAQLALHVLANPKRSRNDEHEEISALLVSLNAHLKLALMMLPVEQAVKP